MDKYILYGEMSSTAFCTIYKGRIRKSITYVNIHCYNSTLIDKVTNSVRHLSRLSDHTHLLEFLEWYRSPDHIWLITELTSDNLAHIMDRDGPLPLNTLPPFISDIFNGLKYIHSSNIVMCDLSPSKILLDSRGNLKLSDFSLASDNINKSVLPWTWAELCECIDKFYIAWAEEKETESRDTLELSMKARWISFSSFPCIFYLSPESLTPSMEFTSQSDLWSVGCIIYELWRGACPFIGNTPKEFINSIATSQLTGLHDNEELVSEWAVTSQKEEEFVIEEKTSVSVMMIKILRGLLTKEREKRIDWDRLEYLITLLK